MAGCRIPQSRPSQPLTKKLGAAVRAARSMWAALLAVAVASGGDVEAQTSGSTVLVSNDGKAHAHKTAGVRREATRFDTGSAPDGYVVESVTMYLTSLGEPPHSVGPELRADPRDQA